MNNDELYHYGVPGMKWGVRNNRATRDANKLVKVSKKYYKKINEYNATIDSGKPTTDKQLTSISRSKAAVQKLVNKLMKKYGSVTVGRGFEADGYTIKYVEAKITELDKQGRVSNVSYVNSPMKKKSK